MRAPYLLLALVGCGPVRLGDEEPIAPVDAGMLDAANALGVLVKVGAPDDCHGCFSLSVTGLGGKPPYVYVWENGLIASSRMVCEDEVSTPLSVSAIDATGLRSAPHSIELQDSDAGCPPPPPTICLTNPSFEGTPAINLNVPPMFDAPPWSNCTTDNGTINVPQILNATVMQYVTVAPPATDGLTYLGLAEDMQASEKLCASLSGGSEVSLRLDLQRLPINAGTAPETEAAFLQIFGGVASDCSQRELLWASPPQTSSWQNYCVTLRPQQFTDDITLRAGSDHTQNTSIFLLVDHLVPVASCP